MHNIAYCKTQFEEYERRVWMEMESLRSRLPPVEVSEGKTYPPLSFERELIGLRLFGDLFDGMSKIE